MPRAPRRTRHHGQERPEHHGRVSPRPARARHTERSADHRRQLRAGAKFQMPWRLLRPRAVELRPANETMVRISNRDNSPIPSRMLEHRGADRAGLAIAVWHRNVRIAEIEGRDRDRIRAGIATAPEPKRKGAAAPGRSGPCVTTRIAHPRYYRCFTGWRGSCWTWFVLPVGW